MNPFYKLFSVRSVAHNNFWQSLLKISLCFSIVVSNCHGQHHSNEVVPIDTLRFTKSAPMDNLAERWRQLLTLTCDEVLNGWWETSVANGMEQRYVDFGYLENNAKTGDFGRETKGGIRPAAQAAYSVAVSIFTDTYDPDFTKVSKELALTRAITVIKSLAKDHLVNGGILHPWGNQWQSAQWASKVAVGGWLLWKHLSEFDQLNIRNMMAYEANRFLQMSPPAANEKYRDNTHAEENGWDATGIQTACALMPLHENYGRWFDKLNEYRLTALASPDDLDSRRLIHGRELRRYLSGYNIDRLGALGNHHAYPHPDYMAAPLRHTVEGALFFRLAGIEVPELNRFNYERVYHNFQHHIWNQTSTIYRSDGSVYWPIGVEEDRRLEFITFGIIDLGAQLLSSDKKLMMEASNWEQLHTARALSMKLTSFIAASAYLYRWVEYQEG